MEKVTMAAYVRILLTEKAQDIYLRNHEFDYYGWIAKKVPKELDHLPHVDRGHWLGAAQEEKARQLVVDAEDVVDQARAVAAGLRKQDAEYGAAHATLAKARQQLEDARTHLDEVLTKIQRAIELRRQFRLDKLVSKLFLRYFHRARKLEWNLYDTRLPAGLREYLLIQLRNQKLSPTALVFLWLVVEENLDHGNVFQLKGLGATDYLAQHALAVSSLDINASEDKPSAMERDYVRELQRPDAEPAHENLDPRTSALDHIYDGLPSLGVLGGRDEDTVAPDDPRRTPIERTCPTCGTFWKDRTISLRGRYYLVQACDNYATTCRFERLTSGFATRKELNDHLRVHAELRAS